MKLKSPIQVGAKGLPSAQQFDRRAETHASSAAESGRPDKPLLWHTVNWQKGAAGEQQLGAFLDNRLSDIAVVLHDRKVRDAGGANIDHLVIAPSGIWVIDAKSDTGRVALQSTGTWLRPTSDLRVGGRKQTTLVEAMAWQCEAVDELVEPIGMAAIPVRPALCFIGAHWPPFARPKKLDGVLITWPERLVDLIRAAAGGLPPDGINSIAHRLSSGIPAAD